LKSITSVNLTDRLKDMAPPTVRRLSRHMKAFLRNWRNRHLSAREVFTRVYAEKMWGAAQDDFYSGPGSNPETAKPYADFVRGFIAENSIQSVVDLGCGDFRVGQMVATAGLSYTGIDVVQSLVDSNNRRFGSESVRFECLDIANDVLPSGELCLIREVFQHISNAQIKATLARLGSYKYVLLTDVQPENGRGYKYNRDKVHGDSSRSVHRSYLRFDAPPFDMKGVKVVFETDAPYFESYAPCGPGFKLRTFLCTPGSAEALT
jgi:SAM-dependent methyltransferase